MELTQMNPLERKNHFRMMMRIEEIGTDPQMIESRLSELDREWDIERFLMAKGAFLTVWGLAMGLTRGSKAWFALPLIAGTMVFKQAVSGHSMIVDQLRRMGFRTRQEIDEERMLLKALRGDFKSLPEMNVYEAVETIRK